MTYRWTEDEILSYTEEDLEFLYGLIKRDNEKNKKGIKKTPRRGRRR